MMHQSRPTPTPQAQRDAILLRMLDTAPMAEAASPLTQGPTGANFYSLHRELKRFENLPSEAHLVRIFALCDIIDRLAASQVTSVRVHQAGELLESELKDAIRGHLDNQQRERIA